MWRRRWRVRWWWARPDGHGCHRQVTVGERASSSARSTPVLPSRPRPFLPRATAHAHLVTAESTERHEARRRHQSARGSLNSFAEPVRPQEKPCFRWLASLRPRVKQRFRVDRSKITTFLVRSCLHPPAPQELADGSSPKQLSMGTGAPGRKAHGGGKGRKNKDHRLHCLQRTIHKNRWDDICATELKVENYDKVVAEKTKLDPDLPGLGQYYCVACRRVLPCTLPCVHARQPQTQTILSCGLHVNPPSSLLAAAACTL